MRKNKAPPPVEEFDRWAKRIVRKVLVARSAEKDGNALLLLESEWGATAYYVYEYVCKLEREGLFEDLEQHLGLTRGPRPSRSGLVMRLVNRASPQSELLSASKRSRLAASLEIAREFGVNPKLVLGFLSEIGSQKAVAQVRIENVSLARLSSYREKQPIV